MVKEMLIPVYCQPILSLKPRKKDARRMEMLLMSRNQPAFTCMTTWGDPCRPSKKWYKYLFWFIFQLSNVNSFVIFLENVTRRTRQETTLLNFRFRLAKQLIAGFSSRADNQKHTTKVASVEATTTPETASGHFTSQREGNTKKRHHVQCKKNGRTTASNRAKETIYEFGQCGIALCKDPSFCLIHSAQISVNSRIWLKNNTSVICIYFLFNLFLL